MEGEAETSVASAHDAGGQSEAGPHRAEAGAAIAACGSLSALQLNRTDLIGQFSRTCQTHRVFVCVPWRPYG